MSPTCEKPRRVARLTAVASSAQTDAAGIVILGQAFGLIRRAREISRYSYRKMVQNVVLAAPDGLLPGRPFADDKAESD